MISQHIELPLDRLEAFCLRYPIRRLSLFGSVLRDDFGPDSDVDVLVEFEPDSGVTLLDMGRMQMDLEEILGREVDFLTAGFLSEHIRDKVLASAITLYERN